MAMTISRQNACKQQLCFNKWVHVTTEYVLLTCLNISHIIATIFIPLRVIAVRCFDNGYVGKQPVPWKEYTSAEFWLAWIGALAAAI